MKESPVAIDHESFYDGRVYGEMRSRATVHMDVNSGVLTAKIETPDEIYHIEPSWRHLDPSDDQSMIAYKVISKIFGNSFYLHLITRTLIQ